MIEPREKHFDDVMQQLDMLAINPNYDALFALLEQPLSDEQKQHYESQIDGFADAIENSAEQNIDVLSLIKYAVCNIKGLGASEQVFQYVGSQSNRVTPEFIGVYNYIAGLFLEVVSKCSSIMRVSAFEYYLSAYALTQSKAPLKRATDFYIENASISGLKEQLLPEKNVIKARFFTLAKSKREVTQQHMRDFLLEFVTRSSQIDFTVFDYLLDQMIKYIPSCFSASENKESDQKELAKLAYAKHREILGLNHISLSEEPVQTKMCGEGTYAKVYQGYFQKERVDGSEVVIRAIKELKNEENATLFNHEIFIHNKLQHASIAKLMGIYPDNKRVVFEYVASGNLYQGLYGWFGKPLQTEKQQLLFLRDLAAAMIYLHEVARIVWRDINLSNIMLDGNNLPKLIDFGLAITIDELPMVPVDWTFTTYIYCPLESFAAESSHARYERFTKYQDHSLAIDPGPEVSETEYGLHTWSDVYGFAMIMWHVLRNSAEASYLKEMDSKALNLNDEKRVLQYILGGGKLNSADMKAPAPVLHLYQRASSQNPKERPTMREAQQVIERSIASLK